MATEVKDGKKIYWLDEDGRKIPRKVIDKYLKKRDKLVEQVFQNVDGVGEQLAELKGKIKLLVEKFLNDSAGEYNEKWQGNTTLYNFSKTLALDISINKRISLDERLQIAKSKIDKYVLSLVKDSNKDLVMLVTRAFNVDKKGNVNVKDILALRSWEIKDPLWMEATDLINKSISISGIRTYYQFKKKDEEGKWKPVQLNFSAL